MKRWLITASKGVDRPKLAAELRAQGCELPDEFEMPCPVDDDEVFQVVGPDDLPSKLKDKTDIKDVHPDSDLTLY